MKLTCPSCETSYEIAGAAMPAEGRKVRCARCGNRWHAPGPATAPEPEENPPAEQDEAQAPQSLHEGEDGTWAAEDAAAAEGGRTDAVAPVRRSADAELVAAEMVDDADEDEEHGASSDWLREEDDVPREAAALKAARRVRIHRTSKRRNSAHTIYGFLIGATLAMGVLAVQYRDDVVRSVPETAQIYSALGMDVNIRGLRFEALAPQRTIEDGVPTLVVEGKILNIRNEDTAVPALHFVLRDAAGDELYNWTIEPLQQALERDGELPFKTRLASPPADAEAVELRFVDRSLSQVGMRP